MEIIIVLKDRTRGVEDDVLHALDLAQRLGFELTRYRMRFAILEGRFNGDIAKLYSIGEVEKVLIEAK